MRKQQLRDEREAAMRQLAYQTNLLTCIVKRYCRGRAIVPDSDLTELSPNTELSIVKATGPEGQTGVAISVTQRPQVMIAGYPAIVGGASFTL